MKTIVTTSPNTAAAFIKCGGLVAFPTETVYGLGANVFDALAVGKIFTAKMRPADNPLIAHIAHREEMFQLASETTPAAEKLADAFFPGPLTIVVKRSAQVPDIATAGLDTIGIRMPREPIAYEFLNACETPVVAPSANLSGRPSPTTWEAVLEDLDGRIDCILQGTATKIGLESTVVDCTGDVPVLLRLGAISLEDLRGVISDTRLSGGSEEDAARSPGLRHKHYSPKARVQIISAEDEIDDPRGVFIGLRTPHFETAFKLILPDMEAYAHSLFEFFRECDRRGIANIYCESVDETGIGAALMDRLRRAAQG